MVRYIHTYLTINQCLELPQGKLKECISQERKMHLKLLQL